MNNPPLTDHELEAFLDEALSASEMSDIENRLRDDAELTRRLAEIIRRRDAGQHSLGAIWRRHRVSCPSREELGAFLLGTLDPDQHEHLEFHLHQLKCRLCQANLEDMQARREETTETQASRRDRYFKSSAGYLKSK